MKKFSKIGKRVMALFIVALMNINTYATTTSNDGSSFITKAEFDALMNNFNNELDKYQSGLNAKIDSSISGYIGGLAGTLNVDTTVGYFNSVPNGVLYVTMQPYNGFTYVAHNPNLTGYCTYGGVNWSERWGNYGNTGSGTVTYNSSTRGKRRMVTYDAVNNKYFWYGYANNYIENTSITWGATAMGDRGFDDSNTWILCCLCTDEFKENESKRTTWFGNTFYWGITTTVYPRTGARGQSCSLSITQGDDVSYIGPYDLMYGDYPTADQKSDNLRLFAVNNPNSRYFAGCSSTYLNIMNAGTKSGSVRYKPPQQTTAYSYNLLNQNGNLGTGINSKFVSIGYEDISAWDSVFCQDRATYSYTDGNSNVKSNKQYYSMIDGAVFCAVEQGATYEWAVEFTDTSEDSTIWLKYNAFNGKPDSNECIKVSVDGGPLYNSGTIKNGKGVVTFTAEKNGLLFLKWSSGKSIVVAKSKNIKGKKKG